MSEIPPAFSFDRCDRCGEPKTILEAMYQEHCTTCEEDRWLERQRPALYAAFGLPIDEPR